MRLERGHGVWIEQEAVQDTDAGSGMRRGPCVDERAHGANEGGGHGAGTDFVLVFFGIEEGLGCGG